MVRRLGETFTRLSHKLMPHPFVFALLLTLLTFALGLVWGGKSPQALLTAWYEGCFNSGLLVFALQMALILVTGHALAETAPVRALLGRLSGLARGTGSAVVLTSLTAMFLALINWGMGLIGGALMARAVAQNAKRRGVTVHYPLVVAAGYTGMLIWHGGFSGSAPVSIATEGHPLQSAVGIIPIQETLLSPLNLIVTLVLLVAVPLFLRLMVPTGDAVQIGDFPSPEPPAHSTPKTLSERMDQSRLLVWIIGLAGLSFLLPYFWNNGFKGVNLNSMIFSFLILGLLLHGTPRRYAECVDTAAKGAGGILLQFPFYFGIMGLMGGAGLIEKVAGLFVGATEHLASWGAPESGVYLVLTFLSGGLINMFVPSGGGQWAVQGPIAIEAATRLSVDFPKVVMALSYGDELTNMLQPFWALPLLGITGLQARHIVGYTAALMLLITPILALILLVF